MEKKQEDKKGKTYLAGVVVGQVGVVLVAAGEVVILLIVVPINVVASDVTPCVDRKTVD